MSGDVGHERLVDKLLAHLAKNGHDERLRELATGIRGGHAGWGESVRAAVYADALRPGLNGFARWYDELSESERAQHAEHCQSALDDLNREQAAELDT